MWSDYFRKIAEKSPLLLYPLLSLALFLTFFVCVLVFVWRLGPSLETRGLLPLRRDPNES